MHVHVHFDLDVGQLIKSARARVYIALKSYKWAYLISGTGWDGTYPENTCT